MRRLVYPPVYLGVFASLLIAVLAVAHARGGFATVILHGIFWVPVYGLGLFAAWIYGQRRASSLATASHIVAAAALGACWLALMFAGAETAFIYLLISLQAARNLTFGTRRDLYFACVVSFIAVLYATAVTKDAVILVYVVLYVLAITFTFMADHIDDRLSMAQGGDKTVLSKRLNFPVNVGLVSAAVIGLAVAIYLFLPRPSSLGIEAFPARGGAAYHNADWEGKAEPDKNGPRGKRLQYAQGTESAAGDEEPSGGEEPTGRLRSGDRFDVVTRGWPRADGDDRSDGRGPPRGLANDIVFYLQADRPLYAKGKTFAEFDGRVWYARPAGSRLVLSEKFRFRLADSGRGQLLGQVYTINKPLPDEILSAYRAAELYFPSRAIKADTQGDLRAPAPLTPDTVYSVKSRIAYVDDRPASNEGPPSEAGRSYLQYPTHTPARVSELARTITADHGDAYAKAVALEQYLRRTYRYTLTTVGRAPRKNMVDEFLFKKKEGHCEIFASTLALMLRAVDVPSRFVTGFAATRQDPFTGYYEVKRLDAHAWVEAYIDGIGWVTFEPTPSFTLPEREQPSVPIQSLVNYLHQYVQEREALGDATLGTGVAKAIVRWWDAIKAFVSQSIESLQRMFAALWMWLVSNGAFLLVGIVVLSGAGYALYRFAGHGRFGAVVDRMRFNRARHGDPGAFLLLCYEIMERAFARRGYPRLKSWTHRDYARSLATPFASLREHIDVLTDLFGLACYSALALNTEHAHLGANALDAITAYRGEVIPR